MTKVLESTGMITALYRSKGEIYSQPESLDFEEKVMLRVAVAVRAGDEILGSTWAAVPERLNEGRTQAFLDAAKLVALHMLRLRAGADVERRLRTDLVATAIEGGPGSPEALGRLGLFGHAVAVVALGLLPYDFDAEDPVSESRVIAERQRLADALAIHLGAVAPRSAVALIGDVAYGLLPFVSSVSDGEHRAKRMMASFFGRLGSKVSAVAGVGIVAKDSSHIIQSRMGADRSPRVMLDLGVPGAVAAISEVQIGELILELGDMVLARGDQLSGPMARLRDYDKEHNGRLLETLDCWLNAFGNGAEAAEAAFVHTNTFRYRLKRVAEVGQIDLSSPDDRFEAMVQLRLLAKTNVLD
ncbi:PucR family transcriptional regulator [Paenarthrobacter sp. NPDC056912]|uniref:PucR family transcriptional regulator n=1 Tax=Paenarthrobacter sp. NPDC056912 TaxID=3345965 RepID=UPI0036719BDD